MKKTTRMLTILLALCLVPVSTFAGGTIRVKAGDTVVCQVAEDKLTSMGIRIINKDHSESTEEGSSSSDVTAEEGDTDYELPSLFIHDDGTIEINGVRYPASVIRSATGIEDITALLDGTDGDPGIRAYMQSLQIDGSIIGSLLDHGLMPSLIFSREQLLGDWRGILSHIAGMANMDFMTSDEWFNYVNGVFSDRTIAGAMADAWNTMLDFLDNKRIKFDQIKANASAILNGLSQKFQNQVYKTSQALGLLNKYAYTGQVLPSKKTQAEASLDGSTGIKSDIGANVLKITLTTTKYENDREYAAKVTQAMEDIPMDTAVGRLATGYIRVEGKTSKVYEYAQRVKSGAEAFSGEKYMAAVKADMGLISLYYAACTEGDKHFKTDASGNKVLSADYYEQHKGDLNLPISNESITYLSGVMDSNVGYANILGYFVDPNCVSKATYDEYQTALQAAEAAGGVSVTYHPGTYLTDDEYLKKSEQIQIVMDAIDVTQGDFPQGLDIYNKPEDMIKMVQYWEKKANEASQPDAPAEEIAKKDKYTKAVAALKEIETYQGIETTRAEEAAKEAAKAIGTNPADQPIAWQMHSAETQNMNKIFNSLFSNTYYNNMSNQDQNNKPTVEHMAALGFDTSGAQEVSLEIPMTAANLQAINDIQQAAKDCAQGKISKDQFMSVVSSAALYDYDGTVMTTDQKVKEFGTFNDQHGVDNVHFEVSTTTKTDSEGYMIQPGALMDEETLAKSLNNPDLALYTGVTLTGLLEMGKIMEGDKPLTNDEYSRILRDPYTAMTLGVEEVNRDMYQGMTKNKLAEIRAMMEADGYSFGNGVITGPDGNVIEGARSYEKTEGWFGSEFLTVTDQDGNEIKLFDDTRKNIQNDTLVIDSLQITQREGREYSRYTKGDLENNTYNAATWHFINTVTGGQWLNSPIINYGIDMGKLAGFENGKSIVMPQSNLYGGIIVYDKNTDSTYVLKQVITSEEANRAWVGMSGYYTLDDKEHVNEEYLLVMRDYLANKYNIPTKYFSISANPTNSSEPIVFLFDAAGFMRDNFPKGIDPKSLFDTFEIALSDLLQLDEDPWSLFERLSNSGDLTEEEQRLYNRLRDLADLVYRYMRDNWDTLTPEEQTLLQPFLDIGELLIPSEENPDGGENPEGEQTGDNTVEEEKAQLARELLEFLISLGIDPDSIPSTITMQWLMDHIGAEEIKKFFSSHTIIVDRYVTIKAEDITVDVAEQSVITGVAAGKPIHWQVEAFNNSGGATGRNAWNDGMQIRVGVYADRTTVTAEARAKRYRTIKTYYSMEEFLVVQPFGWVISNKKVGGTGIGGEENLLSKRVQAVEENTEVDRWIILLDRDDTIPETGRWTVDLTTYLQLLRGQMGYWINGIKYETGYTVIEISGVEHTPTYRID